jgi:hypothetical protein
MVVLRAYRSAPVASGDSKVATSYGVKSELPMLGAENWSCSLVGADGVNEREERCRIELGVPSAELDQRLAPARNQGRLRLAECHQTPSRQLRNVRSTKVVQIRVLNFQTILELAPTVCGDERCL